MKRLLLTLLLCTLSAPAITQPLGCLILPKQEAHIGTPITGVIKAIHVDRGDFVNKGQVLVEMHAEVERAELAVTQARAKVMAAINAAEANVRLAENRFKRLEDLHKRELVSQQDFDQAEAELELAEQQLLQSTEQLTIFKREALLAKARLNQREILAPFNGVIIDRMSEPGERIEHHPVLRLASIDELKVELVMPGSSFGTIQPDQTITIYPELESLGPIETHVTVIDPIIDAASNTYRVRLLLDNSDYSVPSGVRCRAELNNNVNISE